MFDFFAYSAQLCPWKVNAEVGANESNTHSALVKNLHSGNVGISDKFQVRFNETESAFLRLIYLSFSPWKLS